MMLNSARRVSEMFPGFFQGVVHNHQADFGWPTNVQFDMLYAAYDRDSVAEAAVDKTAGKVWETVPTLRVHGYSPGEDLTPQEKAIDEHFTQKRFWQKLKDADRRGLVGRYSGVILQIADNKKWIEPVDRVRGGVEALVNIIPAWEGQLSVSQWHDDETEENYGEPKMFSFNESAVGGTSNSPGRTVEIHPDRVVVWSDTGDVHDTSLLKPGYNDLLDLQKIRGAGGEGFWKAAKGAPIIQLDKEAKLAEMSKLMGVPVDKLQEKIGEHVDEFNKGFHKSLVLQGVEANSFAIDLPEGQHQFNTSLSCFAASIQMPVKILIGMQTGERASTEDSKEWAKTCMSRRTNTTIPNILSLVERLINFGMIPDREWVTEWDDLTDQSRTEKMQNAKTMSEINKSTMLTGELAFLPKEIRSAAGYDEEIDTAELLIDDTMDVDETDDEEEEEDND